jgi:hypothetical protein
MQTTNFGELMKNVNEQTIQTGWPQTHEDQELRERELTAQLIIFNLS